MNSSVAVPVATSSGVLSAARSRRAAWVGGLLGWAAAFSGAVFPVSLFGLRPWHLLLFAAAIVAFGGAGRAVLIQAKVLPVDLAVGAYFIVTLAIEVVNSSELRYSIDFVSVASPLFYFVGYLSARAVVNQLGHARSFLKTFIIPILVVTPFAIAQSLGIKPITSLILSVAPSAGAINRLESDGLTRATGFIGHWTGFGGYLIVIVAAAVALLAISHQLREKRPAIAFWALAAAGICLVTTLTFSVVITAVIIILVCWNLTGFGTRFAVMIGGVGIVASAIFGSLIQVRLDQQFAERRGYGGLAWLPDWLPGTIQYRIRIWIEQTIPMINGRPGTGWGTNVYEGVNSGLNPSRTYPSLLVWPSPESQWLGIGMTFGITGLVVFVVMLVAIAALLIKGSRNVATRAVGKPALILFVMALVTAITVPIFTNRGFPMTFWPFLGVVAGLVVAARIESHTEKRDKVIRFNTPEVVVAQPDEVRR